MAELGAISAAVSLADNAISLIKYLKRFSDDLGTIDQDVKDLIREVELLEKSYKYLSQELDERPQQQTIAGGQTELWSLLGQTLESGRLSFIRFKETVEKVLGDKEAQGKVERVRRTLRLQSKKPQIIEFNREIQTYNVTLTMWMSRISSDTTRALKQDSSARLQELQEGISKIYDRLDRNANDGFGLGIARQLSFAQSSKDAADKVAASLNGYEQASRNRHFDIPQPVDPCYIGRERESKTLATFLFTNEEAQRREQKRFIVHGVGGSGKTQFCCKFAQDQQQRFWGVFWIDGRSRYHLRQSLLQNVAKIGGTERNPEAALSWLTNRPEPWLLIIDNADNPEIELQDYFPRGQRGYVLVTTRNPTLRVLGNIGPGHFAFDQLTKSDASALLLKTADLNSSWAEATPFASKIVETLGYLALAIVVAGRAIRHQVSTIQDYLQDFEARRKERWGSYKARDSDKPAFEDQSEDGDEDKEQKHETTVEAAFDVSYRAIAAKKSREARDALQLLKTFAFMHCENIRFEFLQCCIENAKEEERTDKEIDAKRASLQPESWSQWTLALRNRILALFLGAPTTGFLPDVLRDGRKEHRVDKKRIRRAMHQLEQYSLVTHNPKTCSWSMHPLVHKWAREMPDSNAREQFIWCEAAASLISSSVNFERNDEELMRHLLPHVDEVRKEQDRLEQHIMNSRKARVLRPWLPPWPVFNSSRNPKRVRMSAKFSIVYAQNGRWEDAEVLQRYVHDFTVRVLGYEQQNTRRITQALADTLRYLGRSSDSANLLEVLREKCIQYCGPNSRETLVATCKLGDARFYQGQVANSKKLFEESVAGLKYLFDLDDDDTLEAMDSLGGAILLFGTENAVAEARRIHQQTFDTRKRLSNGSGDDLKTMASYERLCSAATWQKDHEILLEAEKGMNQVIDVRKKVLGREHAFTLLAMLTMARIKVELQDFQTADAILSEGLPVAERNHGRDHVGVLFCRFHLGRLRVRQKRWIEARDILVDVTERQKVSLQGMGRWHFDRIGALYELAKAHNALGEHAECDRVVEECHEAFQKSTTREHPRARELQTLHAKWRAERSKPSPS